MNVNINLRKEIGLHFTNYEHFDILELGCGLFDNMADILKENPNIRRLVGVDDDRSDGVKISTYYEMPIEEFRHLFSDRFKSKVTIDLDMNKFPHIESFNFSNAIYIPLSIEDYFKNNDEKFDLIILRDVLHYYQEEEMITRLFQNIRNRLNPNGLFYVEVATEKHPHANSSDRKVYTDKEFRTLVSDRKFTFHEDLKRVGTGTNLYCLLS